MASSSGSGASATLYNVFLSFRGADTRNTFTDYLYHTMLGQGIIVYRDSEDLHAGARIDDLLRAVGNSNSGRTVHSLRYTRCIIGPARSLKAERGKRFLNSPAKSPISRTNAARLRSKLFSSS